MTEPHKAGVTGLAQPVSGTARCFGEVFRLRAKATPDSLACLDKTEGEWRRVTWSELYEQARAVAGFYDGLGLAAGDRVAILGPTRLPYAVYELGAHLAGLVTLGIYPKQTPEQVQYLLDHSGAKVLVIGALDEIDTAVAAAEGVDGLVALVGWSPEIHTALAGRDSRVVEVAGERLVPFDEAEMERRFAGVEAAATAILIYTSGTTGAPKGAMISHGNLLTFLRNVPLVLELRADDLMISFLPMAHATERIMSFFMRVDLGIAAAYASSIGSVAAELGEVRPTIFGSVPRIYEKIHAAVRAKVAAAPPVRQRLFAWAEAVGWEHAKCLMAGQTVGLGLALRHLLADRLVLSKIRAVMGGRVRLCIVGAAPISLDVLEFFWAIGLPLLEAYGMTEATVVTHINTPTAVRLGSVGRAVPTLEVEIAHDGEVLLRGPLVFQGYYRQPEASAEALDGGWLHTGDIGQIDADGYLRITDRKKHLIVTAGGKNIAPANVERAIKAQSPLISQIHVHGDRRAYISAMIAPSPLDTLDWGAANGVLPAEEAAARRAELLADPQSRSAGLAAAMAKVVADPRFLELFVEPVRRGNRELARVERVRRFLVLERDFSLEEGELTPTMKMRRKEIETKFADRFDRLYADSAYGLDAEAAGEGTEGPRD